ncbi:MAG: prenyltransferase/squalene oxidase repeat-containing protein [Planctomycetota bacterium]|nr:prenyltransferase/squalene oxidase repeat-containing protein [Planctomycetota bacterium]
MKMLARRLCCVVGLAAALVFTSAPAHASFQPTTATSGGINTKVSPSPSEPAAQSTTPAPDAQLMIDRAVAYLISKQDASGGWNISPDRPAFPAITALALQGLLGPGFSIPSAQDPKSREHEQAIRRAVSFLIAKQQPDGGIYDRLLASYNTAISVAALARVSTPEAQAAVKRALPFLRALQNGEDARDIGEIRESQAVGPDHPFYGGVGYGRSGRPDLSNLGWWMEAMHAAGVESSDPAFQRALVFLRRTQMVERVENERGETVVVNDMAYARGSTQGGFIYATGDSKENAGQGQSFAGMVEETLSDGTVASRLRAYGSMTYSGFKSYMYAGLTKDDPRVLAAFEWIRRNYTVDENPGLGTDGMYYYYVVFARALGEFGAPTIETIAPDGASEPRDWRADLVRRLAALQQPDGSFKSVDDRWMENDPVLITAYSLVALREATR